MDRDKTTAEEAKVTKKAPTEVSNRAQEELARQTAELDTAIASGDAEEILTTLYVLWPWENPPNRAAELEPHKHDMIKEMLWDVKHYENSDDYMYLASKLEMLGLMGVAWPELKLIQAAIENLDSQHQLEESNTSMSGAEFLRLIRQGDIEKAMALLDHADYKYGDHPDIDEVFDDKIQLIQRWMERTLELGLSDGIYVWRLISGFNLPWDSVDSWWTDHKAEVLRPLLKHFRDGYYRDVLEIMDELTPLGLRWPELAVIRRSCEAELDSLDEDEDEGPIWRRVTPEEGIVDHMYRRMREGSWMALQDAISDLEERRMPDHMILDALSTQADSIVRWIDGCIREGSHNNRMLGQIWKLLEIGARWPSLARLVNKHKTKIVRDMLTQIKAADSVDLEDLEGHLRQLSELGMTWPEMDVISRSVNAELDRIYNIDESGDMLGYRISKGDLIDGMQDSLRAGVNGAWANNYAHMRPWSKEHTVKKLTGIKLDIVAWVNKYLSSEKDSDLRYGKQSVLDLDDLGVDWPELWAVVDRHKAAWLRRWLTQLKESMGGGHGEELEYLESNIRHWRYLFAKHGLKWPEIDTILASIYAHGNAKGRLGEAQLGDMQGMLRRRHVNAVDYMKNLKLKPGQTLLQRISPIKADIADWVDHQLGQDLRSQQKCKRALITLAVMGADWPELWAVVNRHRSAWIKPWLMQIKEAEDDDWESHGMVQEEISYWKFLLAKHGIKWPEIAIIEKHIQSIADRGIAGGQDQLDEAQITEGEDLRKYVKMDDGSYSIDIPVNQDWSTSGQGYWTDVAKFVRVLSIRQVIDSSDDGYISDMQVNFDNNSWDVGEDGLIYTDPGFLKNLRKFLVGIGIPRDIAGDVDYSEQGMQGDDYVSCDANAFGEYVADQFVIGDAETMDARKTEIIRAILLLVKDTNNNRAAAILNKVKELGVHWPELAAIAKSLRAGREVGA